MAEYIVGSKVVAEALDVTPRRVSQLVKEGIIERRGHNEFDLVDCACKFIRHTEKRKSGGGIDDAKLRKANADADVAEIEAKKLRGEFVAVADVEKEWADVCKTISRGMMVAVSKVAPLVTGEKDVNVVKQTLEEEVREILTGVNVAIIEGITEDGGGGDTSTTEAAD